MNSYFLKYPLPPPQPPPPQKFAKGLQNKYVTICFELFSAVCCKSRKF